MHSLHRAFLGAQECFLIVSVISVAHKMIMRTGVHMSVVCKQGVLEFHLQWWGPSMLSFIDQSGVKHETQ